MQPPIVAGVRLADPATGKRLDTGRIDLPAMSVRAWTPEEGLLAGEV
jgi:hypothetical protein